MFRLCFLGRMLSCLHVSCRPWNCWAAWQSRVTMTLSRTNLRNRQRRGRLQIKIHWPDTNQRKGQWKTSWSCEYFKLKCLVKIFKLRLQCKQRIREPKSTLSDRISVIQVGSSIRQKLSLPAETPGVDPDFKRSATPEIQNFHRCHRFHLKHLQFRTVNIFCSDSVGDNLFPQFDLAEMLFGNAFAFPGPWVKIDGSRHPKMQFRQEPANMLIWKIRQEYIYYHIQ